MSQKKYISCFHDSYISLNKSKFSEKLSISNSDSKKNVSYVTQIVVYKILKTKITQEMIVDFNTKQHFINNYNLIYDYYNNNLEYETRFEEVLPSYKINNLLLPFNNGFLKLTNV